MGWARQKSAKTTKSAPADPASAAPQASAAASQAAAPPELARRRQNRKSTLRSGRTIGEQRERLEKASERQAKHKKSERRKRLRIICVSLTFLIIAAVLVALYFYFSRRETPAPLFSEPQATVYEPTIPLLDEDSAAAGTATQLSDRIRHYVGQAEADFRDLGYTPEKAVLPAGAIREVDFYLQGHPGYIKMHLDRPTAESVEDADRLLRYLRTQGVATFEYLDVRLPGKAYWK